MSIFRFAEKVFYDVKSPYFLWVNNALALVTFVSVGSIVLSTVPSFSAYSIVFKSIEYAAVAIFTVEYLGRVLANRHNMLSYCFSFFGIIDLLSILPTLAGLSNFTFLKNARVLRVLLFLRLLRTSKVIRLSEDGTHDLEHSSHLYHTDIRIYFFSLLSAVIIFASLIYVVEGETNATFSSIPLAMIWSAKVILGGVAQHMPQTVLGDVITILTRFTGLALFGLLISVIGNVIRRFLFGNEDSNPSKKRTRRIS